MNMQTHDENITQSDSEMTTTTTAVSFTPGQQLRKTREEKEDDTG